METEQAARRRAAQNHEEPRLLAAERARRCRAHAARASRTSDSDVSTMRATRAAASARATAAARARRLSGGAEAGLAPAIGVDEREHLCVLVQARDARARVLRRS